MPSEECESRSQNSMSDIKVENGPGSRAVSELELQLNNQRLSDSMDRVDSRQS